MWYVTDMMVMVCDAQCGCGKMEHLTLHFALIPLHDDTSSWTFDFLRISNDENKIETYLISIHISATTTNKSALLFTYLPSQASFKQIILFNKEVCKDCQWLTLAFLCMNIDTLESWAKTKSCILIQPLGRSLLIH